MNIVLMKVNDTTNIEERKVLGVYEVLGCLYIFTIGVEENGFDFQVNEVIPSSFLPDDGTNDIQTYEIVWAIHDGASNNSEYLKRVYLANKERFYVNGEQFELPSDCVSKQTGLRPGDVMRIQEKGLSISQFFKSRDDLMCEGTVAGIILDEGDFALRRKTAQKNLFNYYGVVIRNHEWFKMYYGKKGQEQKRSNREVRRRKKEQAE